MFESGLFNLFQQCTICQSQVTLELSTIVTLLRVRQTCPVCSHTQAWDSQPQPIVNLLMSAALLSAGLLPMAVIRFFHYMNCVSISKSTFFDIKNIFYNQLLIVYGKEINQKLSHLLCLEAKN